MLQHHLMIIVLKQFLNSLRQQDVIVDGIGPTYISGEEDENNQNEQNNRLDLPMQTNRWNYYHENSANVSPTTNNHHHQTRKSIALPIINLATEGSLLPLKCKISEKQNLTYNV